MASAVAKKSVRGRDHLVSRSDAHSHESQPESVRPGVDSHRLLQVAVRSQLLLELLPLGAKNISATFQYFVNCFVNLFLQMVILSHVPVETDFHKGNLHASPLGFCPAFK